MDTALFNPELQAKINSACRTIEQSLALYKRPCVLSSFGKDSVLLLYMIREWFTKDIDVIHFRHPWFQRKYTFADRLAKDWELTVHGNFAPISASLMNTEAKGAEIITHYSIGQKALMLILGKQSTKARIKWLCGRHDILGRPSGNVSFPWDVAFCGHKGSDVDAGLGSFGTLVDVHQIPNSADMAYPLRAFTDADVWEMHERWGIPFDALRYSRNDDGTYFDDVQNIHNADYQPYCTECLDCKNGAAVECPKTGLSITNISGSFLHVDPKQLSYIGA